MKKILKVDGRNTNYSKLSKLHKNGYTLICNNCESELAVALSLEVANQKGIIPGIYCPKDGKHLYIHIYTREAREKIWDRLRSSLMNNITIQRYALTNGEMPGLDKLYLKPRFAFGKD